MNDEDDSILAWNMVGNVTLRKEQMYTSVDVTFNDKSMHKDFSINDDYKAKLCSLSYSGLLLASQCKKLDLDAYEDESSKNFSTLYFRSFKQSRVEVFGPPMEWSFKLPLNERIESIA